MRPHRNNHGRVCLRCRDQGRRGIVTGKRDFRIHPRTYLHSLGPKFREALSV